MEVTWRPAEASDFAFTFKAKREALGPHVAVRWGWDEAFQLELHHRRWADRPWFIIVRGGQPVGTLSVERGEEAIRFGEFYLLPAFQGQGIGTAVLRRVLAEAEAGGWPVRLEYLKWNPVGSLYRRHGFVVVDESDSHYFLVRAAKGDGASEASPVTIP